MPNQGASVSDRNYNLDSLLFRFLKGQRIVALLDRADFADGTLSADSFVLAREIELWLFSTVEGRKWTTRRLTAVEVSDPFFQTANHIIR